MKKKLMLEQQLKTSEISKKLYALLIDLFPINVVETLLITLKNDKNRLELIHFIENGETDGDKIALRTVELNRGINIL